MVVHGSGLDELALHGPTRVIELRNGELNDYHVTPNDFGVPSAPLDELKGGDADFNARILEDILAGGSSPLSATRLQ